MSILKTAKAHVAPVLHNAIGQLIAFSIVAVLTSGVLLTIIKGAKVPPSTTIAVPIWLIVFLVVVCALFLVRGRVRKRIKIHAAQYGVGTAQIDVTERVRAYVKNGVLDVLVTNEQMGRDPLERAFKILTVSYRLYGRDRTIHVAEGSRLVLP
jgi:hypothetical protein